MRIGIIAGNRYLPIILARRIKEKNKDTQIVAVCFKGQTSPALSKYVDKSHWIGVGTLAALRDIIKKEGFSEWIMAGQINPLYIFKKKYWDEELKNLIGEIRDFRPHTIFTKIINYLERCDVSFLDYTLFLKQDLASEGVMNGLEIDYDLKKDIDFGVEMISKFSELDVGQTAGVKSASVVGLESLEGTDNTIKRIYKIAGGGVTILKFCKAHQDLRFDVPVVGLSTLKLLKRTGAASLVLEAGKVIILEKGSFLSSAKKYNIPIVGRTRIK